MGQGASDEKQSTASSKTQGKAKTPIGMSSGDHAVFADLLLQEAAESAKAAASTADPKELLRVSGQAVARTRAALASYSTPNGAGAPTQLFRSVDGAFMGLYDLFYVMRDQKDAAVSKYAPEVQNVMVDLNDRFAPLGWKVPKSDTEGHTRAKAADKAGATSLTTGEKGRLGKMHIRAARQYLVSGWLELSEGKLNAATIAAHNLGDAMSILVDPSLVDEMDSVAEEVAATEQVLGRLVMSIERVDGVKLGGLRELAEGLDALLRLVGRDARWATRVSTPISTITNTTAPKAPTSTSPSQGPQPTTSPATSGTMASDPDRGGPRAAPPQHHLNEQRSWTKKVHIMDTNYVDEYLGYIELYMEAYRTPGGQVYVQRATATKKLEDRGGEFLSMGANVVANSIELKGQNFCDVYFDVQIGGPNKTSTTSIGVGLKASQGDKSEGAEVSASAVFSTAVTSQGTRAFRRVFRISSLTKPVPAIVYENDNPYQPKAIETSMQESERADLHQDFENFELDDDDVGDTITDFYANWVLHSFSD